MAFGRVSFKEDILTLVTDQARSISEPGEFYTTNIMHKSLLENGSDDTADFGDSDEEILHEIGEDDRQLYPDSDWNKREGAAIRTNKFYNCTRIRKKWSHYYL